MGLKGKVKRLEKQARGDRDWLGLQDGTRFYFEPMQVHADLFLEGMDKGFQGLYEDLSEGAHEPPREPRREPTTPPIREALVKATPESLARFEEHYGSAEREQAVIHDDGSVSIRTIRIDGSVETKELEGEEALAYREKVVRQAGQS
jgi:hypothetical protein